MSIDISAGANDKEVISEVNDLFKIVLIIGSDIELTSYVQELFKQKGFLLIGDGKRRISELDLSQLKGKVDKNTRIYISVHGVSEEGVHIIDSNLNEYRTRDLLTKLATYNPNTPLTVYLNACYAGAAAPDVVVLPEGSTLIAYGTSDATTVKFISTKTILWSINNTNVGDPIQAFIRNFAYTVQTATVSINTKNGIFNHAMELPEHILSNPNEIVEYLELERSKFIEAYDLKFGTKTNKAELPAIRMEDAIEWRNYNLIYLASANDKRLIEALKTRQAAFADYVNFTLIDVNIKTGNGYTALLIAAQNGNDRMVEALLGVNNIDVNTRDYEERTALILAVYKRRYTTVTTLLKSPTIDVNTRDKNGYTALIYASQMGDFLAVVILLMSSGIDINVGNNDGNTALALAAAMGHSDIVVVLLKSHNIDVNARNSEEYTVLMCAVLKGHSDIVAILLKSPNIDVNARNSNGYTALEIAVYKGYPNIVEALLKVHDINIDAEDGYMVLRVALDKDNVDVIAALIASGKLKDDYFALISKSDVTWGDLLGLEKETIKLLISQEAMAAYKTGLLSFHELIALNPQQIEEFISVTSTTPYEFVKKEIQYISFLQKLSDTTGKQLLHTGSVDMCPAYLEYDVEGKVKVEDNHY
jgi:ankyrin repeat protein